MAGPNGVTFDGTNDYLTRGGGLTGAADSKNVTGSLWFRWDASASGKIVFLDSDGIGDSFEIQPSAGQLSINGRTAANTSTLTLLSASTDLDDGAWHHALFSRNGTTALLYIDDASDKDAGSSNSDEEIAFASSVLDWSIGARPNGFTAFGGDLAQVFLAFEFVDISVESNRRKFIAAAAANSVDFGSDGSTPTGNQPIIFFEGVTSGWQTNLGTGGGFTENGALTDAATDPPEYVAGATVIAPNANIVRVATGTPIVKVAVRPPSPVGISLRTGTPAIAAVAPVTVEAPVSSTRLVVGTPLAGIFTALDVPGAAMLRLNVETPDVDALILAGRGSSVSRGKGISQEEGVTDVRTTVGRKGVVDETDIFE